MGVFIFVIILEMLSIFLGAFSYYCTNGELYKLRMDVWKKYSCRKIRYIFPPQSEKNKTTLPLLINYFIGWLFLMATIVVYITNSFTRDIVNIELAIIFIAISNFLAMACNAAISSIITYKRANALLEKQLTQILVIHSELTNTHEIVTICIQMYDIVYTDKDIEKSINRLIKRGNPIVCERYQINNI
jgi:hypothetical protein